jgi:indolepyruvate ferredoxin oxidoreductase
MSPSTLLVFKGLAKLKFLRGSFFDIFGRTEERQTERALIQEYKDAVNELLVSLTAENHHLAILEIPC